ncbi:MAG TPA: type II secretion system protein M [Gammaproteobacteria bacterium]
MKQFAEFKAWYLSLQQREQRILMVGAAFLVGMFVYLALLHPYFASRARLTADIASRQAELAEMQPMAARLQSLRGQQPSGIPAGQSLLAVVSRSANDSGFGAAVKQAQTNPDGSVRVQMQAVGFDSVIRWIGTLRRQYGISVRDMTAQRASGTGTVDTTLTLTAGS